MKYAASAALFVLGLGAGWGIAQWRAPAVESATAPAQWVARIGSEYVTAAMVEEEMRQRGGLQPGQFQDTAQKRALLDEMLLHLALVDAARGAQLDRDPETRRSIEQLLTSRYLQGTLRKEQGEVRIEDAAVTAYYDAHADSYAVPARRRVAMLRVAVPKDADAAVWERAEKRARDALDKARKLDPGTPHFGAVAREYSEDAASRYRGGVIGWLTEGRASDYRYDRALLDAAYALETPGQFSEVLRGADGVYVARLVELQARQSRDLAQLRAGIEQRLRQDRYQEIERTFRRRVLDAAPIEIDEAALAAIVPPGPPAVEGEPQPPAMPVAQESKP